MAWSPGIADSNSAFLGDEKEIVQVYEKEGEEQGQTFSVWASERMRSSLPSPVVSKASESTLPSPLHINIHVIYKHMHKHTNTYKQNTLEYSSGGSGGE